jgi:hypothetical protein
MEGRIRSMRSCHHRATPGISRHLKVQHKPDIRSDLDMQIPVFIMVVKLKFQFVGVLVDNNKNISLDKDMHYPKIRLPMPIICWLPCRIAR